MKSVLDLVKALRQEVAMDDVEDGYSDKLQVKLATVIGMQLRIPTAPEYTDASVTYNNEHLKNVRGIVSAINEEFILDVSNVLDLIKKIYTARHNFIYNPTYQPELVSAIVNALDNQPEGVIATPITATDLNKYSAFVQPVIAEFIESAE